MTSQHSQESSNRVPFQSQMTWRSSATQGDCFVEDMRYTVGMKSAALLLLILIVAAVLLVVLITRPVSGPNQRFVAYQEVVERLREDHPEGPSPDVRAAAMERFSGLWSSLTEESVGRFAREVYAPEVWFNDTVKTLEGHDAVADYLLDTARKVGSCTVQIDQVMEEGPDSFVRWTMEVRLKGNPDGEPMLSCGVTHLRFDPEGRILLHQDFWDPAGGIYEHLPGVGWVVRQVRARL